MQLTFILLVAFTLISETHLLDPWVLALSAKFQSDFIPVWMLVWIDGQNITFLILDLNHGLLLICLLNLLNDAKLVEIFLIFFARHSRFCRILATVFNRCNLSKLNDSSLFFLLSLSHFLLESHLYLLGRMWYGTKSPFKSRCMISLTPYWMFMLFTLAGRILLYGLFGIEIIVIPSLRSKCFHDYTSWNLQHFLILTQRPNLLSFAWSSLGTILLFRVECHVINKFEIFVSRYFESNFHG